MLFSFSLLDLSLVYTLEKKMQFLGTPTQRSDRMGRHDFNEKTCDFFQKLAAKW